MGYDVAFDASGKTDLPWLSAAARLNGQIIAIAGRGQHDLEPLFVRGQSLHLVFVLIPMLHGLGRATHGAILERIATLVDAGTVRPLVDPLRFRLRGTLPTPIDTSNRADRSARSSLKLLIYRATRKTHRWNSPFRHGFAITRRGSRPSWPNTSIRTSGSTTRRRNSSDRGRSTRCSRN